METVATCWKAWFQWSAIYLPQLMPHMCMRHISLSIYNGRVTVLATVLCFTLLFNSKTSLPSVWLSPTQRQGHATFVPQSSRGHTPAFIYTDIYYWMTLSFQNTCLGLFDGWFPSVCIGDNHETVLEHIFKSDISTLNHWVIT